MSYLAALITSDSLSRSRSKAVSIYVVSCAVCQSERADHICKLKKRPMEAQHTTKGDDDKNDKEKVTSNFSHVDSIEDFHCI